MAYLVFNCFVTLDSTLQDPEVDWILKGYNSTTSAWEDIVTESGDWACSTNFKYFISVESAYTLFLLWILTFAEDGTPILEQLTQSNITFSSIANDCKIDGNVYYLATADYLSSGLVGFLTTFEVNNFVFNELNINIKYKLFSGISSEQLSKYVLKLPIEKSIWNDKYEDISYVDGSDLIEIFSVTSVYFSTNKMKHANGITSIGNGENAYDILIYSTNEIPFVYNGKLIVVNKRFILSSDTYTDTNLGTSMEFDCSQDPDLNGYVELINSLKILIYLCTPATTINDSVTPLYLIEILNNAEDSKYVLYDQDNTTYSFDDDTNNLIVNININEDVDKSTYTVTFNSNGGTGSMSYQTFTSGTALSLTSNAFTYTGYTFANWNTKSNGTGTSYSNGQSIKITSNITLYALWTANETPSSTTTYSISKASGTTVTYDKAKIISFLGETPQFILDISNGYAAAGSTNKTTVEDPRFVVGKIPVSGSTLTSISINEFTSGTNLNSSSWIDNIKFALLSGKSYTGISNADLYLYLTFDVGDNSGKDVTERTGTIELGSGSNIIKYLITLGAHVTEESSEPEETTTTINGWNYDKNGIYCTLSNKIKYYILLAAETEGLSKYTNLYDDYLYAGNTKIINNGITLDSTYSSLEIPPFFGAFHITVSDALKFDKRDNTSNSPFIYIDDNNAYLYCLEEVKPESNNSALENIVAGDTSGSTVPDTFEVVLNSGSTKNSDGYIEFSLVNDFDIELSLYTFTSTPLQTGNKWHIYFSAADSLFGDGDIVYTFSLGYNTNYPSKYYTFKLKIYIRNADDVKDVDI